jgi:hypothetical protein
VRRYRVENWTVSRDSNFALFRDSDFAPEQSERLEALKTRGFQGLRGRRDNVLTTLFEIRITH